MFGIVWIGIGLWQQMYWVAAAIAAFYLISGHIVMWLFPTAHYQAVAAKGQAFGVKKLAQIERILQNRDSLGF
jgi:hypothetical protein